MRKIGIERIVFLVSAIFIGAAFVVTWFAPEDPLCFIPHSREVVLEKEHSVIAMD